MATRRNLADVCDAVKALIAAALPAEDPAVLTRRYTVTTDADAPDGLRRVNVYPLGYADLGPSSRGGNSFEYRVGVQVGQGYTEPWDDAAATTWGDAAANWAAAYVFDSLHNSGWLTAAPIAGLYCTTAEVVMAFDPDLLADYRRFEMVVSFTFRED